MTTLLLAHGAPAIRRPYETALGSGITVVPFISPFAGLSSSYDALARQLGRPLLPRLYQWLLDTGRREIEAATGPIFLGWWSGGFAFARAMAQDPISRACISGWIALDGGHTELDRDGTASDRGVAWAATLAAEARAERAVFWYGHSQIDPGRYASTAKFIAEVERVGGARGGLFHVEDFGGRDGAAHEAALRIWGPSFCQRAIGAWACSSLNGAACGAPLAELPATIEYASPALPLAERAVRRALAERARGACERPAGSNGGPDVAAYLAGCMRDVDGDGDEDPLRLTAAEWCAASACATAFWERRPTDPPIPHGYRASGIELEQDAARCGAWHPIEDVRAGRYAPRRGDLATMRRGSVAWQRHVVRVVEPHGQGFLSIGGNENGGWGLTERRLDDPALRGFIAYPG